jgi:hypothetical protein
VGITCCNSFLAGHCCAAAPPKSLFTSVLIVEGRKEGERGETRAEGTKGCNIRIMMTKK